MDLQAIVVRTHVSHYFDFSVNILYKFVCGFFPFLTFNYQLYCGSMFICTLFDGGHYQNISNIAAGFTGDRCQTCGFC